MIQAGASANTNFNAADMLGHPRQHELRLPAPRAAQVRHAEHDPGEVGDSVGGHDADGQDRRRRRARATSRVFPVTMSFVQDEATWNRNRAGQAWISAGGDLGPAAVVQNVPNVAGAKVSFDVTALVRTAVSGATSSRYTRIALADLGASTERLLPRVLLVEGARPLGPPGAHASSTAAPRRRPRSATVTPPTTIVAAACAGDARQDEPDRRPDRSELEHQRDRARRPARGPRPATPTGWS